MHDDHWFLEPVVKAVLPAGPVTVFVSRLAWDGSNGPWERSAEAAELAGAEVVLGDWSSESDHRRAALEEMRRRKAAHFLCLDGDEVCSPELLDTLEGIAKLDLSGHVRCRMETYWKSASYAVRPREDIAPVVMLDARHSQHVHIREYTGRKPVVLTEEHGLLHHLSYAGPDERIRRKVATWGHRHEVVEGWFQKVWLGWDEDRTMRDLHPTHPACYRAVERVPVPEVLATTVEFITELADPAGPQPWPKVSIVVPVFGAAEEVRLCLASLEILEKELHEVVVVDDHGPRDAIDSAKAFKNAKVVETPENLGFAGACNRGYREATGDVVVFLNSDAELTRAALYRLIETLVSSPSVGAAGPFSDGAGYFQHFPLPSPTTDHAAFAQDFAHRDAEDFDTNMLVGFCLAVKREAIDTVGGVPFDIRYGKGFFEDNDLTYRLQRARLRTVVSARSFVRHTGGASMRHLDEDANTLLRANQAVYEAKWHEDIATGFASHLSGPDPSPVRFDWSREPQKLRKETAKLAKQADISLCVIAKDEERVIGDMLKSVKDVFTQVVVVDTGSSDRTREIAKEHGAEVHDFPWTMSFSEARNESLRHATGRWVMWMDCDDTLPASSARQILKAVVEAPSDVNGFVVPVRFVDGGPAAGTQVDHLKVFRNHPSIKFERHIHEQVLGSVRALGGQIAFLRDAPVLHSGYDTSEEGQLKKRARDWPLLDLDLAERPDHPFDLFNCGMTAHYEGRHAEAVGWLAMSIKNSGPDDSHLPKAYALKSTSLRDAGRPDEALTTLDQGLAAVPGDPELLFLKGVLLASMGAHKEALASYTLIPDGQPDRFGSVDLGIFTFKKQHNVAVCHLAMGNYLLAREWFLGALASAPWHTESAVSLFDAARAFGDPNGVLQTAEAVLAAQGPGELWATMHCARADMLGLPHEAALQQLWQQFPQAEAPGLLMLRPLLELGDMRRIAPVLEHLDNTGSAEAAFIKGLLSLRSGDFASALKHMRRADQRNPGHDRTKGQIAGLEQLIAEQGTQVLNGHAGVQ